MIEVLEYKQFWEFWFFCFSLYTVYRNEWLILAFNDLLAVQSVLSIDMKSSIKKLLVLIDQSCSGYLIYFGYKIFDRPVEASMWCETKCLGLFSSIEN